MRLAVGSDERTTLTDTVVAALADLGHEVDLVGPLREGDSSEWAEVGAEVGRRVADGRCEQGVVFCWTGTGASIAANKVAGVRAALCADAETARMARRYNRANVLVMSLRSTSEALGAEILGAWFEAPPPPDAFDERNVSAVSALDAGRRA